MLLSKLATLVTLELLSLSLSLYIYISGPWPSCGLKHTAVFPQESFLNPIVMASLRLALTCFLTPSPPKATENFHAANTEPPQKKQVFHASEIPEWMQWDPYIQHGYRTQLNSFKQCFLSLFYMHNESVNTWSHIVLEISFLILLLAIDYWIAQLPFKVPFSDMLAIQSYVAGTAGCLVFSAAFHTTNAHSPEVARAFLKLDYFGIVLTISTTCISVAYFTSTLQLAYILFTVLCAAMVFCITLDVGMDGARAGPWRATVFLLLAASDLAPIFHVGWNEGKCGLFRIPLDSLTVTCSSYAIGTLAYVTRFPERYWPGRFDLIVCPNIRCYTDCD
ncbi:hemolysin-III related-domain-containing protein [Aspergillus flavus]|uniref:Hemolysin-III related-domain-containing protein n=1 Tax=Aspergillus flavus (strain ATCC 200026 / FGSC A1120 / IAM 13836 / NRRL 3357 / JCM 12722 / SRRC 167) TaxID=332952 RepID=A0A7U2QVD7_ASPFN|nr:hemolysin-III related-domain-containing protein [Aspergillus flavus]